MNQLTMFDLIEDEPENQHISVEIFEIGEPVKVRRILEIEKMEPEDLFYLKEFSGKKGVINLRTPNSKGEFSYKVEFNKDKFGYFYADDLVRI